jgi:hypothetical protein
VKLFIPEGIDRRQQEAIPLCKSGMAQEELHYERSDQEAG